MTFVEPRQPLPVTPRTEGMRQALAALNARHVRVPADYKVPVSTFPKTAAAREALRYNHEGTVLAA